MNKTAKKIVVGLFAGYFGLGLGAHLLLPDRSFSENENRVLAKMPPFSLSALADGSYTDAVETYIADQFPLRDGLVALKATAERMWGRRENNGIYLAGDRLIEQVNADDTRKLMANLAAINRLKDVLNVPINLMPVPTAAWLYAEELPAGAPTADQDALIERIKCGSMAGVIDLRPAFREHAEENLFYRTDHHWTSRGAYYAAAAYLERRGDPVPSLGTAEVLSDTFNGTLYSASGYRNVTPDTIEAYADSSDITVETWRGGSPETIGLYDRAALETKDKYTVFLGGNTPLSVIRTGHEGRQVLIVRDSYADCFVPFLTESYSEIHLFDARYYKMPLTQYIEQNDIDEVLVLYSLKDLLTDENLQMVCK